VSANDDNSFQFLLIYVKTQQPKGQIKARKSKEMETIHTKYKKQSSITGKGKAVHVFY
jgi:hypothetical protein